MRFILAAALLLASPTMASKSNKGAGGGGGASVSIGAANESDNTAKTVAATKGKQGKGSPSGTTTFAPSATHHGHHSNTKSPTKSPSSAPSTKRPSSSPIASPSASPTERASSSAPSLVMSGVPTLKHSEMPSVSPVATPSSAPTVAPTTITTNEPSIATNAPVQSSSASPTKSESTAPSVVVDDSSVSPTKSASTAPSVVDDSSSTPTLSPTATVTAAATTIPSNAPSAINVNSAQSISIEMYPMRMQIYWNDDDDDENSEAEATTTRSGTTTISTTTNVLIELTSRYMLHYFESQLMSESSSYDIRDIVLSIMNERRLQPQDSENENDEDEADLEITLNADALFDSFPVPTKRTLAQISHEAFNLQANNAAFVSKLQTDDDTAGIALSRTNRVQVTILDGSNTLYGNDDTNENGNTNSNNNGNNSNIQDKNAAPNDSDNNASSDDLNVITGVAIAGTAMTLFVIALLVRSFRRKKRHEKNLCDELLYGDLLFDDDDESQAVNSLVYDPNAAVKIVSSGTQSSDNASHDITLRIDDSASSSKDGGSLAGGSTSTASMAYHQAVRLGLHEHEHEHGNARVASNHDDYLSCSSSSAEGDHDEAGGASSPRRSTHHAEMVRLSNSNSNHYHRSNYDISIEQSIRNSARVHHQYFGEEEAPVLQFDISAEDMANETIHGPASSYSKKRGGSRFSLGSNNSNRTSSSSDFSGAMSWYRR